MDKSGEKSLQTAPSWDTKGTIITMASFMTTFITLGIVFSAGPIISEIVRAFDNQSTAKIAWIFSIMNGTSMLAGLLASALSNRFGHRAVILTGSVLGFVGLAGSYLTPFVDVLFFTIGVTCGTAVGLVHTPSIVAVGLHFDSRRRGLATGIAMCGSGVGTFILAPLVTWLLANYGLQGTFLILSAIFFNCAVFGALIIPGRKMGNSSSSPNFSFNNNKSQEESRVNKCTRHLNCSLLRSPSLILICASSFLQTLGWLVPFTYLSAHAVQMGLSKESAAFLLSLVGICGTAGRIMAGWLADLPKVGVLVVNNVALTVAGVLFVICPYFTTYESLIIYSVILGIAVSFTAGTRPVLVAECLGVENINDGFGFVNLFYGLGNFISTPLAGLLYDVSGDYSASFYVAGAFVLISAFLCYPLGWVNRWEKKQTMIRLPHDCDDC